MKEGQPGSGPVMLNMKALILSSNNGGGHNTVSAAIKECIEDHGGTSDIRDSLSFISDAVSDMISFSHVFRTFRATITPKQKRRIRYSGKIKHSVSLLILAGSVLEN